MFHKFLLLVCLSVLGQTMATPSKLGKRSFLIGDYFYTVDTTANRNRAQALSFCEGKGGELAKMAGKSLYNIIQASTTSAGGYWIDGIDKSAVDRFAASTNCTSTSLDFAKIPEANLDFSPLSCLIFNKATTAATTKIQAVSCSSVQKGVVCATPVNDCEPPPTPDPLNGSK